MNKEFLLVLKINGRKIREKPFTPEEIKLVGEGVNYAKIRDFTSKRKTEYKNLLRKIMLVVKGENRWKPKNR